MEDTKKTVNIAEQVAEEQAEQQAEQEAPVEETPAQTEEKPAPFTFDYDKLAEIVNGKQSVAEDKVLKGYFEQHGVTGEEMESAINAFKEQKALNTPDIGAMQSAVQEATQRALQAEMQAKAMMLAGEIGVDVKGVPFLIRASNLDEVVSNGAIDEAKLRASLEAVLDAFPALKATARQGGFQTVGADTVPEDSAKRTDDQIAKAFGVAKK